MSAGSDPFHAHLMRGIKQGCPLSGLLFSLCFGPVIRKLQEASLFSAVAFNVFADDLAASSWDLITIMPCVVRVLARSGG
eukprot:7505341-Pyramimonas_sp.AAC.1